MTGCHSPLAVNFDFLEIEAREERWIRRACNLLFAAMLLGVAAVHLYFLFVHGVPWGVANFGDSTPPGFIGSCLAGIFCLGVLIAIYPADWLTYTVVQRFLLNIRYKWHPKVPSATEIVRQVTRTTAMPTSFLQLLPRDLIPQLERAFVASQWTCASDPAVLRCARFGRQAWAECMPPQPDFVLVQHGARIYACVACHLHFILVMSLDDGRSKILRCNDDDLGRELVLVPCGSRLLAILGRAERSLYLWNVESGAREWTAQLRKHPMGKRSYYWIGALESGLLAFSFYETSVFAADEQQTVMLIDPETGNTVAECEDTVICASLHPCHPRIVVSGPHVAWLRLRGHLVVWDGSSPPVYCGLLEDESNYEPIMLRASHIPGVVILSPEKYTSRRYESALWRLSPLQCISRTSRHAILTHCLPSASLEMVLLVSNVSSNTFLAFSLDSQWLDTPNCFEIHGFGDEDTCLPIPATELCAMARKNGRVLHIVCLSSGTCLREFHLPSPIFSFAVHPCGVVAMLERQLYHFFLSL